MESGSSEEKRARLTAEPPLQGSTFSLNLGLGVLPLPAVGSVNTRDLPVSALASAGLQAFTDLLSLPGFLMCGLESRLRFTCLYSAFFTRVAMSVAPNLC